MKKIRVGALISGGGTNLQAIIDSCESEKIDARMVFTGSDNPLAKGLDRAKKHNIPWFVVDYKSIINSFNKDPEKAILPNDFNLKEALLKQALFPENHPVESVTKFIKSRVIAEAKLLKKIYSFDFDLLILAGFMRKFTPYFIDRINTDPLKPRIMNIHPALLPAFPGSDGYGDTFRYGCKIGGCTVHFVDYGEDSGRIIGQKAFQIQTNDDLDSIKKKGLEKEWELYPECIQMFAQKMGSKI